MRSESDLRLTIKQGSDCASDCTEATGAVFAACGVGDPDCEKADKPRANNKVKNLIGTLFTSALRLSIREAA
jgi:hypothetical protein